MTAKLQSRHTLVFMFCLLIKGRLGAGPKPVQTQHIQLLRKQPPLFPPRCGEDGVVYLHVVNAPTAAITQRCAHAL